MAQDRDKHGLATIVRAFNETLADRGVVGASVEYAVKDTEPRGATFKVTVDGRTEEQHFGWQEIDDCGNAIDAPAALKVRMLVSHFVR